MLFWKLGGSRVTQEFRILHDGWEADNVGWVTEDGRVWTTSHAGSPYEMSDSELDEKIGETVSSLQGLMEARKVSSGRLLSGVAP